MPTDPVLGTRPEPQNQPESSKTEAEHQGQHNADRLQMLLEISRVLTSNWDLEHAFAMISARLRRVLQQEYAGFELHDASTALLVRQAEDFPLGKGLLASVPISVHNSPGGRSLQSRTPMVFSRSELEAFHAEITRRFLAEGMQSLCCIPVERAAGPLGVLVLGSTRENAFRSGDLEMLSQVGALFGLWFENQRALVDIQLLRKRLAEERRYLDGEIRSQGHFAEIIGESPALRQVLEQVTVVATSDATVLIGGETGTGKELIARAIHRMSRRRDSGFIKVNCAAIPTGLLESELFGHEKGAFTGAVSQKIGRVELADCGTLFLDEVGEISPELQPKLLRVLQDQEFERLGGTKTIRVNVRLIAATNRDLARSVADRQFRSDLFYRLHVFPIHMPSLRERREDIPVLVSYFVRKFCQQMNRHIESISKETMEALKAWSWPGNIRELENLMERSVILTQGNALHVPVSELKALNKAVGLQNESLNNAEREHILRILREAGGTISGPNGAAKRLGLKRTTLQSKMRRLNIERDDYTAT